MHKRARSWTMWLGVAVTLSVLAAGAALLVSSQQATSDRESLKNEVSTLKSQAGTGQLLAEQALAGNVTDTFVRAQSEQMSEGVEKTRESLTPEGFEPSLSSQVLRAGDLALRLDGALKALGRGGVERAGAASAARSLAALYAELKELEDGLKQ